MASRPGKVCGLPLARDVSVDNFNAVLFGYAIIMISRRTPEPERNSSPGMWTG